MSAPVESSAARVIERESLLQAGVATEVETAQSPAEAMAAMDAAMANLDRAIAEERQARGEDVGLTADEDSMFMAMMEAEGFGGDWGDDDPRKPETAPQPGAAGAAGIGPKELLQKLAERGVVIHRDTLHTRLRALPDAGQAFQPRRGKWAAGQTP